jgi:hypothetical protein
VNSEGAFGEPDIITAARNNDAEMVDLLVKFGGDLDLPPIQEMFTALAVAVSSRFLDMERIGGVWGGCWA